MDEAAIVRRLRAPTYWMSGSSEGHEGENDAPREAADIIESLYEALDELQRLASDIKAIEANPRFAETRMKALRALSLARSGRDGNE